MPHSFNCAASGQDTPASPCVKLRGFCRRLVLSVVITLVSADFCGLQATQPGNDESGVVLVESGSFEMGSPPGEPGRFKHETQHNVTLTRAFYLGHTEVAWSTWNRVREWGLGHGYTTLSEGNNGFRGDASEDHPVIAVSWWDAVHWCNARSEMEGRVPVYYRRPSFQPDAIVRIDRSAIYPDWEASGYRLPTEAEWEYVYRSGDFAIVLDAEGIVSGAKVDQLGWHAGNSATNTHPVGMLPANRLGLHDMAGNVWEWCWDWDGPYPEVAVQDPTGPSTGKLKSMRGGSWTSPVHNLRAAHRHAHPPYQRFYNIGFRVARTWAE